MASAHQDNDSEMTAINITPLVDIMLVLLIIFMVAANIKSKKTIEMQLPKSETGTEIVSKATFVELSIDKNSNLFLDNVKMDIADIEKNIAQRKTQNAHLTASISADDATPHGTVVKLIDVLRKNDIIDFSLDVETK